MSDGMATRRHAREWALQLLFQLDVQPTDNLEKTLETFWAMQWRLMQEALEQEPHVVIDSRKSAHPAKPPKPLPECIADRVAPRRIRAFMESLVRGVLEKRDEIDDRIVTYADHWPLHRMGGVDRNVLRIAMFEMFCDDQAPPVVVINEAVDLAKFFSSSESGKFVNGILDRACKDVTRPPRDIVGNPVRYGRRRRSTS